MDLLGYPERFELPEGCTDGRVLEALELTHGLDSGAVASALQVFGLTREAAVDLERRYASHCSRFAGSMSAAGSLVIDGKIQEVPRAVTAAAGRELVRVGAASVRDLHSSPVTSATVVSLGDGNHGLTFSVGLGERSVRLKVQCDHWRYRYANEQSFIVRSEWHNSGAPFVFYNGMEFQVEFPGVRSGRQVWELNRVEGSGPFAEYTGFARLMAGRMMRRPTGVGGMIEGLKSEADVLEHHGVSLDEAAQMLVEELSCGLKHVSGYLDIGGTYYRVAPRVPNAGIATYGCVERTGQYPNSDSVLWYGSLSSVRKGVSGVYRIRPEGDGEDPVWVAVGDVAGEYGLHYFDLAAGDLYVYADSESDLPQEIAGYTDRRPATDPFGEQCDSVGVMEFMPWENCTDVGILRGFNEPSGRFVVPKVCGGSLDCDVPVDDFVVNGLTVRGLQRLRLYAGDRLDCKRQSIELQVSLPDACVNGACGYVTCDRTGKVCVPRAIARLGSPTWHRLFGGSVLDSPVDAVAAWRHQALGAMYTASGVWSSLRCALMGSHGPLPRSAVLVVMYEKDKYRVLREFADQLGPGNRVTTLEELGETRCDHVWLVDYAVARVRDRYSDPDWCVRALCIHTLTFKYVRADPGGMICEWMIHNVDPLGMALVSQFRSLVDPNVQGRCGRRIMRIEPWSEVASCVSGAAVIFLSPAAERAFRFEHWQLVPAVEGLYQVADVQGKYFDRVVVCVPAKPTVLEEQRLDDSAYCHVLLTRHSKSLVCLGEVSNGGAFARRVASAGGME